MYYETVTTYTKTQDNGKHGLWLQDEASYQRYLHSVKDYNYKVMVQAI